MTDNQDELVFYVTLKIKQEKVVEWLQAANELIDEMAQEPEFISCDLQCDSSDPCTFTLFEKWREPSMEAFIANQMKPYRNTYEDKLPDYLESPRQASVLTPLKQWLAA